MPGETWIANVLEWLWSRRNDIGEFLLALARQPVALAFTICLFVATLFLALQYYNRSSAYEALVDRTFDAQTENTPQSYKGIEAFIFSYVPHDLYGQLRETHLDPGFVAAYNKVEAAFMKAEKDLHDHTVNSPDVTASTKNSFTVAYGVTKDHPVMEDNITNNDPTTTALDGSVIKWKTPDVKNGFYTEQANPPPPPGFLFLPAYLVHERESNGAPKDLALLHAVEFGRHVAGDLQDLSTKILYEKDAPAIVQQYLRPIGSQVYLISVEGVNRSFKPNQPHPFAEYGSEFPGKTFFPGRPYFWPTLEDSELLEHVVQEAPLKNSFEFPDLIWIWRATA
jgi:hypothetical protein